MNEALTAMPSREGIRSKIANKSLQNIDIYVYESTDSTNTRAKEHAKENCGTSPAVFIALEQTAGRGRMGRRFESPRAAGLYISFLTFPEKSATDPGIITAIAAVKTARAIEAVSKITVGIKWVNDLIVGNRKLTGILTEGEYTENGNFAYVICGIGINLKSDALSPALANIATSIEEACGTLPDPEELAARLIEEYFTPTDERELMDEYRSRCVLLGKGVTVHPILGEPYEARAVCITDTASLLIEKDGEIRELKSAEVSIKGL